LATGAESVLVDLKASLNAILFAVQE